MLGRTLKMAFWVMYDHLGKLILANLLWALGVSIPGSLAYAAFATRDVGVAVVIGLPMTLVTLGVVLPVLSAGIAHLAKELIETRDGSLRTMWTGIRLYWRRAMGIGVIYVVAAACLTTSIWFYGTRFTGDLRWVGILLSALALWALVFLVMTVLLVIPTLVQKRGGLRETLKLAALLVLDNTFLVLGLGSYVLCWTVATIVLLPLFLFFYGAGAIVYVSAGYELLARRYAVRAEAEGEKAGHVRPLSAAGAGGVRIIRDEEDDYLNRGFRDALFPWKG